MDIDKNKIINCKDCAFQRDGQCLLNPPTYIVTLSGNYDADGHPIFSGGCWLYPQVNVDYDGCSQGWEVA